MTVTVPNALSLGTIADGSLMIASDERNNFTAVQVGVNGLIAMFTNAPTKGDLIVSAGGGVFDRLGVGANGQAIVADSTQALGMKWGAAGATTYRASGNPLTTVVNSAALADVLNQSLAAFAATGIVRFRLKCDYLNNSGSNRGIQLKLMLGATTLIDATEGSMSAASATRATLQLEGAIQMADATHAHADLRLNFGGQGFATVATGLGGIGGGDSFRQELETNGQVVVPDVTSSARTLQVQLAHSAPNASLDVRVFDWVVEVF